MADIQPFRAIRYDLAHVGELTQVVAPPYDVIDSALQADLYVRHPANIVRVILNRDEPGDEPGRNYERAANFIKTWLRQGLLVQDAQPGIYIYHQEFDVEGRSITRRGFIARVRLEPYGQGKIFPHEQTHSKAKEDRLNLMRATGCNTSQIFSIYDDPDNSVQQVLEAGVRDRTPYTATDDLKVVHKLWVVNDTTAIAKATSLMGSKPLYIADGHHRYETALNYRDELGQDISADSSHPANYISMCCVSMSDPGMIVLPTHRLWRGIREITGDQLSEKLASAFETEPVGKGAKLARRLWERLAVDDLQSQMAFYTSADDSWLLARLTDEGQRILQRAVPEQSEVWRSLGVAILHELVPRLLGYENLPPPKYVRKFEEVVTALEQGDEAGRDATGQVGSGGRFELATLVMPATVDHIREISKNNEKMPAKSTYFYPKLLSGLVINPLYR